MASCSCPWYTQVMRDGYGTEHEVRVNGLNPFCPHHGTVRQAPPPSPNWDEPEHAPEADE